MDDFNTHTDISDKTTTFRFNPFDSSDKSKWCDVTTNVKEIQYEDGTEYYYISYEYVFSNETLKPGEIDDCHPFYESPDLIEHIDGDIIVKNSMSEQIIEYLLMGFDELEAFTGRTTSQGYKGNLMRAITYLWD
jgi:hypothetical protein